MIKAIIFDWGGVLIKNPAEGLINFCAKRLKVKPELLKKEYRKYEKKFQKGVIKEKILWKNICNELSIPFPKKLLWGKAVKNVFKDNREIYSIVKKLKKKGYKLGFLSNTELPAKRYFFEKNYNRFFDVMVFSCDKKLVKPQLQIFHLILKKLKVKPSETIFVDDNELYVRASCNSGIKGIVFKNEKKLLKDFSNLGVKIK